MEREVFHVVGIGKKENGSSIFLFTIFFEGHTSLVLYVWYTLTMSSRTLMSPNGDCWILSFGSTNASAAYRFTVHFDPTGNPDSSLDGALRDMQTLGEQEIRRQVQANNFNFTLVLHWNEGGPNDQEYQNALRYCQILERNRFLVGLLTELESMRALHRELGNDVGGNGNDNEDLGECFGDPNDPFSLPYAGAYDIGHRDGLDRDLWKLLPFVATPDKFVCKIRDYDGGIVIFQGGFPTIKDEEWNALTRAQRQTLVAANPAVRPLLLPSEVC